MEGVLRERASLLDLTHDTIFVRDMNDVITYYNLIMNGLEAMNGVVDRARELNISSGRHDSNGVLIAVRDSGKGLDSGSLDHLFDAFFTTKRDGMGMGLAICRSIIEAHGGTLWASPNAPTGAVFQFTLPAGAEKLL